MGKHLESFRLWLLWHLEEVAFWAMLAAVALSGGEYVLLTVLLAFGDAEQAWCKELAALYVYFSVALPGLILAGLAALYFLSRR